MAERGDQLHRQVFHEFTNLCLSLQNLSIPTVAEVYGLAAAAGFQLAMSCDLLVASSKASFSTPGVKFGVFCTTPGVALARNLSAKLSMKMLLTGEPLSAQEAMMHGLLSDLVNVDACQNDDTKGREELERRVSELIKKIAYNSRPIVALGKKAFYKQTACADIKSAYEIGTSAMLDTVKYEDTQSGLKAFASKKKPVWSHSDSKLKVN